MEDWKDMLRRAGWEIMREVCKARCNFQGALQEDRRRRVQSAGSKMEGFLEAGRVKEAWDRLTLWY